MSSYRKRASVTLRSSRTPLELRLINHRFQTVAFGVGVIEKKVPAGLYQIEIRAGEARKREYIELKPGESFSKTDLDLPFRAIAPVSSAENTHESHGYPTEKLSRKPNRHYGTGGRLVLIFRNVGQDYQQAINVFPFELLNGTCDIIDPLQADSMYSGGGIIGLSADVTPGGYVLRNHEEWLPDTRSPQTAPMGADLPLWVESEWTTIVFIPNFDTRPVPSLQYASIYMTPIWAGFQYDDGSRVNAAVELALNGLRQGRSILTTEMLDLLLNQKFVNPMLGIIGAQAMLLAANTNWKLFDIVRRNLKKLIPNHPDVTALFVVGKERRGNLSRSRVESLTFPPMLAAAYRGVINRDAEEPGLIVGDSLADQAASRLYQQGPWSLWKPFTLSAVTEIDEAILENIAQFERPAASSQTSIGTLFKSVSGDRIVDTESLRTAAEPEQTRSWKDESAIDGESVSYELKDLTELSRKIGLPVSSVARAMQTISKRGYRAKE